MFVDGHDASGNAIWIRKPYRPEDYTPTPEDLDAFKIMAWMNVRELLQSPEGPFGAFWVKKVERDGKTYWECVHRKKEWVVLIEDTDEPIVYAEMIVLPPEEARDVSKWYDKLRQPMVDES
jgi:hypothetical protein